MKKLIVGLLAAFLMTSGLVAFSGSPASARPADCPYQGCVDTRVNAKHNVKGKSVRVKVKVKAVGNVTPKGVVTLTVVKIKKNGNFKAIDTIYSSLNKKAKTKFKVRGLKKGKYAYAAEYENNEKFGFNYSTDNGTFRIKKKK
jgi:hypothetical protein